MQGFGRKSYQSLQGVWTLFRQNSRRGSDPIPACSRGWIARSIASDRIASDRYLDRQRTESDRQRTKSDPQAQETNPIPRDRIACRSAKRTIPRSLAGGNQPRCAFMAPFRCLFGLGCRPRRCRLASWGKSAERIKAERIKAERIKQPTD